MNKSLLGLSASVLALVPMAASALEVPVLTVNPQVVDTGENLTLTLDVNEGRTWPTVWFTKGTSETALSSWAFPCYQMCFGGMVVTTNYLIPTSWAAGTDYYAKVYDHVSGQYIKTNFTVESAVSNPIPTVTVSPQVVAPGQVMAISLQTNGAQTSSTIYFTKGINGTAIAQTTFPCGSTTCTDPATAYFTIPKWKNGNDYYVQVYDATNNKYIKVNFAVKR